jgi:hypothetical protein
MTHRTTAALAVLALSLATFAATRPAPAQTEGKNLFSSLKIGQMVELAYEQNSPGYFIRTYDDPAKKSQMVYKVVDIQDDYITLHIDPAPNPTEIWDIRIPSSSVMSMFHVRTAKKK